MQLLILLFTIFVPPVGVALKHGLHKEFLIALALTIFGLFVPGLIYALYVNYMRKGASVPGRRR